MLLKIEYQDLTICTTKHCLETLFIENNEPNQLKVYKVVKDITLLFVV